MAEWDVLMDTNVRGLFMCNQLVVRAMLEHGGGTVYATFEVHIQEILGVEFRLEHDPAVELPLIEPREIGARHEVSDKCRMVKDTRCW